MNKIKNELLYEAIFADGSNIPEDVDALPTHIIAVNLLKCLVSGVDPTTVRKYICVFILKRKKFDISITRDLLGSKNDVISAIDTCIEIVTQQLISDLLKDKKYKCKCNTVLSPSLVEIWNITEREMSETVNDVMVNRILFN